MVQFTCSAEGCDATAARLTAVRFAGLDYATTLDRTLPPDWSEQGDGTERRDRERTYCPAHAARKER